jgi:VRR-NUC domain
MRWSEQDLQAYLARRGTIARPPRLRRPVGAKIAGAAVSEEEIQRAVFAHLAARGCGFAFHPANGGWRSPIEAAILKGQGVKPGVPDIIVVKDGMTYALELKADGGRLSPAQTEALEAMRAAGAEVGVAFGLDEALRWLERHKILRGRAA